MFEIMPLIMLSEGFPPLYQVPFSVCTCLWDCVCAHMCALMCVCVHVYIYVSGIYAHMCEHVCEARVNPGCLSWYSPSFKTGSLAGLERIYQIRLAIQAPVIHHLYLPVLGLQALTTTPECLCFQVSSRG